MQRSRVGVVAAVCAAVVACSPPEAPNPISPRSPTSVPPPAVEVSTLLGDLDHPWDLAVAPDGAVLTGERSGRFVVRRPDGSTGELAADLADLHVLRETGLMGLTLSRDFPDDRTVYTCQGHRGADRRDVRVVSWTVDPSWTTLTRGADVLTGLPMSDDGRHSGCRLLLHPDGALYVGTGDSKSATVPQDPTSLGGKVLRINLDGSPAAGNPDPVSPVYTLGHRNVQGLALQPGTGRVYSIEQGTHLDDEVNLLRPGGNYGWRPDRSGSGYDEDVPMTDPERVPGALAAVWSSGYPTIATPGGTFLDGPAWGDWSGALVVTSQQGEKLVLLRLSEDGRTVTDETALLDGQFGRLRSALLAPDGALLVTTDNGSDDRILRITPAT
ncbi:PQQ-dependent sugar dehydrogenase [Rhodococcus sp. NPDC054953]